MLHVYIYIYSFYIKHYCIYAKESKNKSEKNTKSIVIINVAIRFQIHVVIIHVISTVYVLNTQFLKFIIIIECPT